MHCIILCSAEVTSLKSIYISGESTHVTGVLQDDLMLGFSIAISRYLIAKHTKRKESSPTYWFGTITYVYVGHNVLLALYNVAWQSLITEGYVWLTVKGIPGAQCSQKYNIFYMLIVDSGHCRVINVMAVILLILVNFSCRGKQNKKEK